MGILEAWRLPAVLLASVLGMSAALADGDPQRGKDKATATCMACHGLDGNSPSPEFPKLNGQYEDYLVQTLTDYQSGRRRNAIMQAMAAPLSKQDIQDLAAWFASQPGLTATR